MSQSFWIFISLLYITPIAIVISRALSVVLFILKYPFNYTVRRTRINRVINFKSATSQKLIKKLVQIKDFFNQIMGRFEYYIRSARNYSIGILLIGLILFQTTTALLNGDIFLLFETSYLPLFFLVLTFYTIHLEIISSLRMAEFLRANPALEPSYFFRNYYALFGPFPYDLPDPHSGPTVSPVKVSFKKSNRSEKTSLPTIIGFSDTAHLAHISLKSLKFVGKAYAREIFDNMASMWGKRILQLTKSQFEISGTKKLEGLSGKNILVFNHKSQLDFVLGFFAFSSIKLADGRGFRPRFITAKDHFLDNPLIYDILGVGRLIETVDMVFIERKKKGKGVQDLDQAATFLSQKDIDITIFPQGTRAHGNIDRSGKRRDAGYYTTISPKHIENDLAHIRKGTAFMAADTLLQLCQLKKESETLNIIPTALHGTATVLAKQSLQMQTESDIRFVIGDVYTLKASLAKNCKKPANLTKPKDEFEKNYLNLVEDIHQEIDKRLIKACGIHEALRQRFVLDLQGHFRYDEDRIKKIENYLIQNEDQGISYQILDRIYACPSSKWNSYLSVLAQLILEEASSERLRKLRHEVTLEMLGKMKTRVHGKRVKRRELKKAS